jgi:oligoribonuclease NrnB/cAMP/cGMP phosphodiesterase (DHH superfamily)
MNKKLCIYHGNCADGFGAAWVVRKFFGEDNVEFVAGVYQTEPPDVTGRDVIMVDFSYKLPVVREMLQKCNSMLIIDHHKSAMEDLATVDIGAKCPVIAFFDLNHSGAMLAWNHFFSGEPPQLLKHIEDRDLWRFQLEGTREIQAALFSYPYDFKIWDDFMKQGATASLFNEGCTIERKHFKDIHELLKVCQRKLKIGGCIVPVASLPYTLSSDAGHIMSKGEGFAACYYDTPTGRCFSLRSAEDGMDVSEIAKLYGGGGHKHAAGFTVPFALAAQVEIGEANA